MRFAGDGTSLERFFREVEDYAKFKDKNETADPQGGLDEDGNPLMTKTHDGWKCTVARLQCSHDVNRRATDLMDEVERNDWGRFKVWMRKIYRVEPHIETIRIMDEILRAQQGPHQSETD